MSHQTSLNQIYFLDNETDTCWNQRDFISTSNDTRKFKFPFSLFELDFKIQELESKIIKFKFPYYCAVFSLAVKLRLL